MLHRLTRVLRLGCRLAIGLLLLGLLGAGVSWALGGLVVPPLVVAPPTGNWKSVALQYPADRQEVEITIPGNADGGGVVLSGLYTPSDEGAPLVLHLAGSGISVRSAMSPWHRQDQLSDLAHLGFASLAVDYRGVGFSSGEVATRHLGDDALAMWEHALTLVNGDPSRIILRGCSMGTIAMAELLATGIRPGGVIAIAPVRAQTVAIRYGLAWLPGPTAWLTRPFLKDFAESDTSIELCRAPCPPLLIAHEDDELLSQGEYTALVEGMRAAGGTVHRPDDVPGILPPFGPVVDFMPHHIGLAHSAMSIEPAEASYLLSTYAQALHADERLAVTLEALSADAKKRVAREPGALPRLRDICRRHRFVVPRLAAAVACALSDEDLAASHRRLPWPRSQEHALQTAARWNVPFDDLVRAMGLDDPDGNLPVETMQYADWALGPVLVTANPMPPRERIEVLADVAFAHLSDDNTTVVGRRPAPPSTWWVHISEEGHIMYAHTHATRGELNARIWNLDRVLQGLRSTHTGPDSTLRARFKRCLLKAAGLLP